MKKKECIKSWEDFSDFLRRDNQKGRFVYRGVSNKNFDLTPRIGRKDLGAYCPRMEKDIFDEFKDRALLYLGDTFTLESDLEWLALAQHHGPPTRLLDWTWNPLVAAFFAVEGAKKADAAIYRIPILEWRRRTE